MGLIEINKNPSRKDLLVFAQSMAAVLAIFGLLLYTRYPGVSVVLWWLVIPVAAVGAAAAWWLPGAMRLVYLAWIYAVYPIGWTISHFALAVVYYLVVTPIGLMMRLVGRDPMQRKFDRSATTYWHPRNPDPRNPSDPADKSGRYFRQF